MFNKETFIQEVESQRRVVVTWLNHSSLIRVEPILKSLEAFTVIGVDGLLLKFFLRKVPRRTSADLILPQLLNRKSYRVALIGGTDENRQKRLAKFNFLYPDSEVVMNLDGFECRELSFYAQEIAAKTPNLIIIGMGSPHQEKLAIELANLISNHQDIKIFTCGGWLDQILYNEYYPKWAYPLRLNWLVRLFREPGRLWKRYTFEPFLLIMKWELLVSLRNFSNLK